jgi:hypothetical protein
VKVFDNNRQCISGSADNHLKGWVLSNWSEIAQDRRSYVQNKTLYNNYNNNNNNRPK